MTDDQLHEAEPERSGVLIAVLLGVPGVWGFAGHLHRLRTRFDRLLQALQKLWQVLLKLALELRGSECDLN